MLERPVCKVFVRSFSALSALQRKLGMLPSIASPLYIVANVRSRSVVVAIPTGDLFFVDSTEPEWLFVLLVACSHLSIFCGF